jgi:peptidylprolyl isomerase/peptidyl-prolyl cis-trans isomerase C
MKHTPEVDYAIMRISLEMFNSVQEQLDEHQRKDVLQRVNREMAIGKRLLESDEASGVVIPDSVVQQSFQSLVSRFESEDDFTRALAQNHLNESSLMQALAYELKVEAVLERLLNEKSSASDEEAEIYYFQHLDKFQLPETRTARHILITVNDDYQENTRDKVKQRFEEIKQQLQQGHASFEELASRYSECPTAMHEGLLGRIKPGQLYTELDQALFEMEEGECSDLIETEVGLHILKCDQVHQAGRIPFEEVREKLRSHLEQKKRKRLLQEWLHQAA